MKQDVDLTSLNTFRVPAKAGLYVEVNDLNQLDDVIHYVAQGVPYFILGGGANVLFVEDFQGLVMKNNLRGCTVVSESETEVELEVASGEDWTELVEFAVSHNWSGIENLAFIPGTIGAAVVQNIAAYGQNFEDVFVHAEAVNILTGEHIVFNKTDCQFNYRSSVFKRADHYPFFITAVRIRLSKIHAGNTSYHSRYESLASELMGKDPPFTAQDIYQAVVALRMKKLPDWRVTGTAGSFFKNPVVSKEHFLRLQEQVAELQSYPVSRLDYLTNTAVLDADYVKVPAGRLLDELGWKGKKIGNVGTFERQALVVINLGNATGREILNFSEQMAEDIRSHYEIILEPEVRIVTNS